MGKCSHAANPGHGLDQDVLSLAVKLGGEDADPRRVAIWPGKRFYQSLSDHIVCDPDDRNRFGRLLYGANRDAPAGIDDIGLGFDQLRRIFRNQIDVRRKMTVIVREVLALDEAATAQFLEKGNSSVARVRLQRTK